MNYAEIIIHIKTTEDGGNTFEWVGDPTWPVKITEFALMYDAIREFPWPLKAIPGAEPLDSPYVLFVRTDTPLTYPYYYTRFFVKKWFEIIRVRFLLTLEIWGLRKKQSPEKEFEA